MGRYGQFFGVRCGEVRISRSGRGGVNGSVRCGGAVRKWGDKLIACAFLTVKDQNLALNRIWRSRLALWQRRPGQNQAPPIAIDKWKAGPEGVGVPPGWLSG